MVAQYRAVWTDEGSPEQRAFARQAKAILYKGVIGSFFGLS
jgi:hypothetical protein